MIRPFYHSRLFWLGVPGLVFLLWGWWDSERHYTELSWMKPRSFVAGFQHRGRVAVIATDEATTPVFTGSNLQFTREDELPFWQGGFVGSQRFEEARSEFFPGLYRRRCSLPCGSSASLQWLYYREWGADWWLIAVSYAGLWLAAVTAWQRRKARIIRRERAA